MTKKEFKKKKIRQVSPRRDQKVCKFKQHTFWKSLSLSLSLSNSVTGLLCVWQTEIETETKNLIARFALEWKLFESKPPSFENRSLGNNRSSLSQTLFDFFNQNFVYFRSSAIPISRFFTIRSVSKLKIQSFSQTHIRFSSKIQKFFDRFMCIHVSSFHVWHSLRKWK